MLIQNPEKKVFTIVSINTILSQYNTNDILYLSSTGLRIYSKFKKCCVIYGLILLLDVILINFFTYNVHNRYIMNTVRPVLLGKLNLIMEIC